MQKESTIGTIATAPLSVLLSRSMKAPTGPRVALHMYDLVEKVRSELPHVTAKLGPKERARFNMVTKAIHSPMTNYEDFAHEAGHAYIDNSRMGKVLQNPITATAGNLVPDASLVGGMASGYADERNQEDHKLRDALVGLGVAAPQLAYEAGASIKGHQLLKNIGVSKGRLSNYDKNSLKAWGTYGLQPVSGAINYGFGRSVGRSVARKTKRKETDMKKQANTYEGVMYAAMADELSHIAKEKVAINLAPAMGVLQNVAGRVAQAAPRAITAMEGLGGHVVQGLEAAGHAGLSHAAPMARQMGQGVITGLNKAEHALGGAQALNRAAGAGAAGLAGIGALGAAGAAHRAVAGRQPTQIVVR